MLYIYNIFCRFLPPPAVYKFGPNGKEIVEPSIYLADPSKYKFATLDERIIFNLKSLESEKSTKGDSRPMPFDSYCPSMQTKLDDCVCNICGSSWPCAAAVKRHKKAHTNTDNIDIDINISTVITKT